MGAKRIGLKAFSVATALVIGAWTQGALADLQSDVAGALGSPTPAARNAALSTLATSNAGNFTNFTALTRLVVAGIGQGDAASAAGALAAACGAATDNTAITRVLVSTFVQKHPGAGGGIFAAIVGAGCSTEVAAATLQSSLATAAGQALSLVPTLPPNNPGTGVNLLQQAFLKSRNTTRLGSIVEGDFNPTGEGAASPNTPLNP